MGDTDFLRPQWIQKGAGLTLLLNLVDWCLESASLSSVRSRSASLPLEGLDEDILGQRPQDLVWVLNLVLLPGLLLGLGLLSLVWRQRRSARQAGELSR